MEFLETEQAPTFGWEDSSRLALARRRAGGESLPPPLNKAYWKLHFDFLRKVAKEAGMQVTW